jgi:thiamine biosynthesis lipoprotein
MSGRFTISAALVFFLFSLPAIPSCARDSGPLVRQTFVMGTRGTVTIYGLPAGDAEAAASEAIREMHRIESVMSTWREESEISRLNRDSRGRPVRVSAELFTLLEKAYRFSELTGGAFDVTARPIVRLWGFQGGEAKLPTEAEIADSLSRVGWRKMVLDTADTSVTLTGGSGIDLAGIGKGYAVDRCARILRDHGAKSALVDLGGNMFAIGAPPGRDAWSIGIRDPEDPSGVIGKLLIRDEAVATSGNYENFVVIDGKKYGHIVDPRTGRTVDHVLGVTVVAPSATESDALSTGLFVLGPEESARMEESFAGVGAVFALPDDVFEFVGDLGGKLELFEKRQGLFRHSNGS